MAIVPDKSGNTPKDIGRGTADRHLPSRRTILLSRAVGVSLAEYQVFGSSVIFKAVDSLAWLGSFATKLVRKYL